MTQKQSRLKWLRLAGSVIAIGLLVFFLAEQGWADIFSALSSIAPWRLALALGLMSVSRLAVTTRWYVLLRHAGQPVTFLQTLRITFAGLFASNFLPTTIGGDLVRLVGILQLRQDAAVGAASLIADRLVGMAGMAMAVPFSLPALLNGGLGTAGNVHLVNGGMITSGYVAGVYKAAPGRQAYARGGWRFAVVRWGLPGKLWNKARQAVTRLYQALVLWLRQPRALLEALACTWVHMLCVFSIIALIMDGIGEHMPFALIAGLYSLVYFVTLLPVSINGYGLQELSMTVIFSNLGQSSVGAGAVAALLFRTLMMALSLPGALFVPDILAAARKTELAGGGEPLAEINREPE